MKPDPAQDRRRELNRLAAQKLRNRQKEHAINIRQEYFNAQSNNTRLVYEKKQLHKERETLKMNLDAHLRFCQQQSSNLFAGNHIIYLAGPTAAFTQPIMMTHVDQNTSEKSRLSATDSDSQNESDEVDDSRTAPSDNEECDKAETIHDIRPDTPETVDASENDEEDTPPLVIVEGNVRSLNNPEAEKAVVDAQNETPVIKEKTVENNSRSDAVIPIMVLDMNELSES